MAKTAQPKPHWRKTEVTGRLFDSLVKRIERDVDAKLKHDQTQRFRVMERLADLERAVRLQGRA
jgi:hypothetical protein